MWDDMYMATEVAKMRTERAERQAAEAWRFRNLRSREQRVLTAILTSVLRLFIR